VISIIILAHDKLELTRRCLESICRSQIECEYELLLVDNGSTPALQPLAEEFRSRIPAFQYLRNRENLTFSVANNLAVQRTRGNRLLFLNNDVIPSRASLSRLDSTLKNDPQTGVTGARLLFPDGCRVQHAGMAQMLWGYPSNYAVGVPANDPRVEQRREMWAVTGAMMCVDRQLFDRVGGFSPQYRWGYEDVDLCLKVRQAGKTVLYVPEADALHVESATLGASRSRLEEDENYRLFREAWDPVLVPRELEYVHWLRTQNVRRVVIFGAGRAAAGLFRTLIANGIDVAAFATSNRAIALFCERPTVNLADLHGIAFDRLMAGTQFFFEVEEAIAPFDPEGQPIFPALGGQR
jgi:GT2 family glycosyltransferase